MAFNSGDGAAVRLAGLGTAVPPHELPQSVVEPVAARVLGPRYPEFQRLAKTFQTSGIERRYSVCDLDWFQKPNDWPERTARYLEGATALFADAAQKALHGAGWQADTVDTVVTVSSTGIATPTLEARVFGEMGFRTDIHRVPIFGLGCAGGVTGLSVARRLTAAPGSRTLLVCVETCTLSFRDDRLRKADIIATVLFGDGAAAVCLENGGTAGPLVGNGVEHLWPDTLDIMGWEVDKSGFGVIFDRAIPPFVQEHFADAVAGGLRAMDLTRDEVSRFVCHPGGAKVVSAIEDAMGIPPGTFDHERDVLRHFGNMSAPTVLFVLEKVMAGDPKGTMVAAALGPGFTASMLPLHFDD